MGLMTPIRAIGTRIRFRACLFLGMTFPPPCLAILLFPCWHIEYSLTNQAAYCPTSCTLRIITVHILPLWRRKANRDQAFFLDGAKASVLRILPPSWTT